MTLARMASLLFMYGASTFVALSTAFKEGLAQNMTNWRGEKWVKELDYVYLAFGCVGILASVNRLSFITGRIESGDLIAAILLTTAVVIRFVKTRAEIAGCNKAAGARRFQPLLPPRLPSVGPSGPFGFRRNPSGKLSGFV
jgi:hypothetical protein